MCKCSGHGPIGRRVHDNLKPLGTNELPKLEYYKMAERNGLSSKPDCKKCYGIYPNCRIPTTSVLTLASQFQIVP